MIDYLLIGHVCQDITAEGPRPGGTVTFGALTARALGRRPAIITSLPDRSESLLEPLAGIPLIRISAENPTTFVNAYTSAGRVQTLEGRAAPLGLMDVPSGWRGSPIVHLAPVADEVDPRLAAYFPDALIGVTPQGWMRQWDSAGRVSFRLWPDADAVLARADAVVMSIEDVQGDESLVESYASRAALLVVTRARAGCAVYLKGQAHHIPAPAVEERDLTGAGDIFAAAFFVQLHTTGDPLGSARFATALASDSVTRIGLAGIPTLRHIESALAQVSL